MPDEATEPQEAKAPEATADVRSGTPPWGENFDPAIAWEKIQKANREAANLRERVTSLEPKAQQFERLEEASKSELQRLQESLETSNREREAAQSDALRFRVAATHGIAGDDLDLLGTGDEDQLTARATRIRDLRAAAAAAEAAARPATVPQRPTEQLRPGATPTNQLSEDDALYEQIYGSTSNI